MSDAPPKLRYIAWRKGRPRFVPGRRERAIGFKGEDLRHPNGEWFTPAESMAFSEARYSEIQAARGRWSKGGYPVTPKPTVDPKAPGYVYFLRTETAIKIGFSKGPFSRVARMMTAMSQRFVSLGAVPAIRRDEGRLHKLLAPYRQHGEWFDPNQTVTRVMIRALTYGSLTLDQDEARAKEEHETRSRNGPSPDP